MKNVLLSLILLTITLSAQPSAKLPKFAFKDVDGIMVKSDEYKGKVVVLDFWATWCLSCKKAIPVLNELGDKYASKGLEILGMNTDKKSVDKIIGYLIKNNIGYRTLLVGRSSRLAEDLEVFSMPMIYVFDRKGKLVTQVKGFEKDDKEQLLAAVNKLMK